MNSIRIILGSEPEKLGIIRLKAKNIDNILSLLCILYVFILIAKKWIDFEKSYVGLRNQM